VGPFPGRAAHRRRMDGRSLLSFEELEASEGPIHILSLDRRQPFELFAKERKNQWQSLDWAADGNGLYVSADAPGGSVLLYLDLKGDANEVWKHPSAQRRPGHP
jgi:hypothetical protein